MKALQDKIISEGTVISGEILKVGSFLNQQLDIKLIMQMGREIAHLYRAENITKILTIEASGIAIAVAAASELQVPVVFAKKSRSSTQTGAMYSSTVRSFTHGNTYDAIVAKEYLSSSDRLLLVDDFLARGGALHGLLDIASQAGATVCGCAIAIEKGFQGGGDELRASGIRVDSLAIVDSMSPDCGIKFRDS